MGVLLKTLGKCSGFRAKPAHISGHLPPAPEGYVTRIVHTFAGASPRCLPMTCFSALAVRYGPQYLVEAFGLSLPQAARYGKLEEYLLEEEVKQQREECLEMSRHL
jgi:hypothetical protein